MLGGGAAVEKAAKDAGHDVKVPFTPGRGDASQEETDVESVGVLEPRSDGFRNYRGAKGVHGPRRGAGRQGAIAQADRAGDDGSDRRLACSRRDRRGVQDGVFTKKPGTLTNDFFVNLLDMSTEWKPAQGAEGVYEGRDRKTGEVKWSGTRVDLIFGSHSLLRALAEVYASSDGKEKFVKDFAKAWVKVMNPDRFDFIYKSEPALKIAAE